MDGVAGKGGGNVARGVIARQMRINGFFASEDPTVPIHCGAQLWLFRSLRQQVGSFSCCSIFKYDIALVEKL